jgi:hypothetical protein
MDNPDHFDDDYGIVDESFEDAEQHNDIAGDLCELNSVHGRKKRFSIQPPTPVKSKQTAQASSKPLATTSNNNAQDRHLAFGIDRACEFAECLMHCILFKINYYNKKTHFDKALKYNIIVYVYTSF